MGWHDQSHKDVNPLAVDGFVVHRFVSGEQTEVDLLNIGSAVGDCNTFTQAG